MSTKCLPGLPKPPHVKAMFDGDAGLLAGMGPGKVWIDHSTTDHEQNKVSKEQPIAYDLLRTSIATNFTSLNACLNVPLA